MRTLRPVVLASASGSRRALLEAAGVTFDAFPADLDEGAVKLAAKASGQSIADTALALARAKAGKVGEGRPDALIIGADQMLELEGEWFDKPSDLSAARRQLQALRGRTHFLHSAVVLMSPAGEAFAEVPSVKLTMRAFSDDFLDDYLADVGEDATKSVGGYFLEGVGAQLFESVEGDYFTVLGLPMAPLLSALRREGALLA